MSCYPVNNLKGDKMKKVSFVSLLYATLFCSVLVAGQKSPLITDDRLQVLIKNLGSHEPEYAGIASEIALAGSRAVPQLIRALSSDDYITKKNAIFALGFIKDLSAIPALIQTAKEKQTCSEAATDALGEIGGPEVAAFFIDSLQHQEYPNEKMCYYLGLICDNRAVPILCKMINHKNISCAYYSAWALGQFRDPRSRNALKQVVEKYYEHPWDTYRMAKKSLLKVNQTINSNSVHEDYLKHSAEEYIKADIETVILKSPEPEEGTAAYIQKYIKKHPTPKAPRPGYGGPTIDSFVTQAQYDQSRQNLLLRTKDPHEAEEIVEQLLEFAQFFHPENRYPGPEQTLKTVHLISDIGNNAKPALEKAAKFDGNIKRVSRILIKMMNEKKTDKKSKK